MSIYEVEKDGSLAFFVVPKVDNLCKFIESNADEDQQPSEAPIDKSTQKIDGLGRIRTGDLRHVKAEDSELSKAFSAGDMTTRKLASFVNSLIDSRL
ncbi:MAG TPA: hypothetical protein VEB88_01710 [Candidatus Acidoferrales bacterium]|nr:hypothetical protein [Candidatus Acidoferrales bacterium]